MIVPIRANNIGHERNREIVTTRNLSTEEWIVSETTPRKSYALPVSESKKWFDESLLIWLEVQAGHVKSDKK